MRDGTKNLIPFNELTEEEQRAIAIKGGIASGEARREKRTLREQLEIMLELIEEGQTNREIVSAALLAKAKKGDTKAFELVRDTVGEKPTDNLKQSITGSITISEEDKKMLKSIQERI